MIKKAILRKKYVVPQLLSVKYVFMHQYFYVEELDHTDAEAGCIKLL